MNHPFNILIPQGFGKVDGKQALEEITRASTQAYTSHETKRNEQTPPDTTLDPSKFHPAVKASYYLGLAAMSFLMFSAVYEGTSQIMSGKISRNAQNLSELSRLGIW